MKHFFFNWNIINLRFILPCILGMLWMIPAQAQTLTSPVTNIDFGFVPVAGTVSQLVTLTNSSATESLTINEVAFFGPDSLEFGFLFPNHDPFTTVTVPAGGTVDVYLTFTPAEGGDQDAIVEFVYTALSPGPSVLIDLTGDGCANFDPGTPGDPFVEVGGKVTIEIESQAPTDQWVSYTYDEGDVIYAKVDTIVTPDTVIYDTVKVEYAPDDMTFYTWEGNNNTGWTGSGNITYAFTISDVSEPYRLMVRSENHPDSISTAANDLWFKFNDPGVIARLENPNEPLPPPNDTVTVKNVEGIWFKIFNSVGGWTWYTNGAVNINGEWFEGFTEVEVYFPSPGTYSFTVAGRATGFSVDKIALWQNGFPSGAGPDQSGTAPAPQCPTIWFQDADGDSYGNILSTAASVGQPGGFVDNSIDCDDNEFTTNPFAAEINSDGIDNNCDGYIDEGFAVTEGCNAIRINGAEEATPYTTSSGVVFDVDLGYADSPTKDDYTGAAPAIANTDWDELYHTLRSTILSVEDMNGTDSLNYTIPVGDQGNFLVKLHFAELFWDFPGQRVFDIVMEEGTPSAFTYQDFDILANTGAKNTAFILSNVITINDSVLNIAFRPTANKPVIAGIEVLPLAGCGDDAIVFPLEWVNFSAVRQGNSVALNWQTANEQNNDFFTIERSQDGLNFNALSQVASKGNNSGVQHYQSYDENPLAGKNYYRVKQTDIDGNFTYSQTVEISVLNELVRVYPNPVRKGDELVVAFELQSRDEVEIELLNALGQTISLHTTALARGTHEHRLQLDKAAQGYYFLKITTREGTQIRKIFVAE